MDAYSKLVESLGEEGLEKSIGKKIKEMGGLLTREAAIRILAKEHGIGADEVAKLAEIAEGANKSKVKAKVVRILPARDFGNGKKMRKIALSDQSGERELKLWNADAEFTNGMHAGDVLEVSGIYCKGGELSLGYGGGVQVLERASFADLGALGELEGMRVNARGYVESVQGLKEYEKDGEKRRMFSFALSDGKNAARVVMWGGVERGAALFPGAEIKVESALVRNLELHLNSESRILVKKKKEGLEGKVDGISVSEGKMTIVIDGKEHIFERDDALRILGMKVADDIALETAVELKKAGFLGKEIFVEMKGGMVAGVKARG